MATMQTFGSQNFTGSGLPQSPQQVYLQYIAAGYSPQFASQISGYAAPSAQTAAAGGRGANRVDAVPGNTSAAPNGPPSGYVQTNIPGVFMNPTTGELTGPGMSQVGGSATTSPNAGYTATPGTTTPTSTATTAATATASKPITPPALPENGSALWGPQQIAASFGPKKQITDGKGNYFAIDPETGQSYMTNEGNWTPERTAMWQASNAGNLTPEMRQAFNTPGQAPNIDPWAGKSTPTAPNPTTPNPTFQQVEAMPIPEAAYTPYGSMGRGFADPGPQPFATGNPFDQPTFASRGGGFSGYPGDRGMNRGMDGSFGGYGGNPFGGGFGGGMQQNPFLQMLFGGMGGGQQLPPFMPNGGGNQWQMTGGQQGNPWTQELVVPRNSPFAQQNPYSMFGGGSPFGSPGMFGNTGFAPTNNNPFAGMGSGMFTQHNPYMNGQAQVPFGTPFAGGMGGGQQFPHSMPNGGGYNLMARGLDGASNYGPGGSFGYYSPNSPGGYTTTPPSPFGNIQW